MGLTGIASTASAAPGGLLPNGTFDEDAEGWNVYGGEASTDGGQLCVAVPAGDNPWDAAAQVQNLTLEEGEDYTLTFRASATPNASPRVVIQSAALNYKSWVDDNPQLTGEMQTFTYDFTADANPTDAELGFQLSGSSAYTFCLDDVSLAPAGAELVSNGSFDTDAEGWNVYGGEASTEGGRLCIQVPPGDNPWDAAAQVQNLALEQGASYTLTFSASATPNASPRVVIQSAALNYKSWVGDNPQLTGDMQTFSYGFTVEDENVTDAELGFQLSGTSAYTFCLDDVSLKGGGKPPAYEPETGPRVRVNQVGYLPNGPKQATLVTDATSVKQWALKNGKGVIVLRGRTQPAGVDPSSKLNVHVIDFSGFKKAGSNYTLISDGSTSHPFNINASIYERLRVDAASYFYPVRSGIAIDGSIVGDSRYTRPAGHVSSPDSQAAGSTNLGDFDVPCQNTEDSTRHHGEAWTCDYTLDVAGGWYDAGDHGKYVVNGGISAAQLLQTWERNRVLPSANKSALGDNSLRILEHGNGVPDILDEAKWEVDWMVSMQVPAGSKKQLINGKMTDVSGMVHHKIHDADWTGIPLMPHRDPQVRELHRPSTAATLNLAAVAAQASRLIRPYDVGRADTYLAAAKRAYAAAKRNPAVYAPDTNALDTNPGGGPYNDTDVSDEFFWAAAELWITTKGETYRQDVLNSPVRSKPITPNGALNSTIGLDWGNTAPLGWVSLAHKSPGSAVKAQAKAKIVNAANRIVAVQNRQAFGQMYRPTNGQFDWGSNNLIANNMVIVGTAHDLTRNAKFKNAVLESMDYLLGRNALNQSYITGYGEQNSKNQHSRWFANQANGDLPNPPRGSLAGGPNSTTGTWDPTWSGLDAKLAGGSCVDRPQWCYVDHIQSWATNEITVNWNSVLTWAASYAADQRAG